MFERGKTNMNRRYRKTIIAGNWKMNKTPAEAKALNLADSADAKLQTLTELFKNKKGTDWLGFNRLFESNIRKTSDI